MATTSAGLLRKGDRIWHEGAVREVESVGVAAWAMGGGPKVAHIKLSDGSYAQFEAHTIVPVSRSAKDDEEFLQAITRAKR